MSELCMLAASVVLQSQAAVAQTIEDCVPQNPTPSVNLSPTNSLSGNANNPRTSVTDVLPAPAPPQNTFENAGVLVSAPAPAPAPVTESGSRAIASSLAQVEFSLQHRARPHSTAQLFQQRWEALRAGQTYTRLPVNSFANKWQQAHRQPTYGEWLDLLTREARNMSYGQGNNGLTVLVGDSLSMWMPTEFLPRHRFWLNQAVSGETATSMTKRLHLFKNTRPDVIHVMAGINDLKNGATDREVLLAVRTLMRKLRQQHPNAKVVVHSILPTRLPHLSSDRIRTLNGYIAYAAQQEGTHFVDLQQHFTDTQGLLRQDLTTDGLHLNYQGYVLWQSLMHQVG